MTSPCQMIHFGMRRLKHGRREHDKNIETYLKIYTNDYNCIDSDATKSKTEDKFTKKNKPKEIQL